MTSIEPTPRRAACCRASFVTAAVLLANPPPALAQAAAAGGAEPAPPPLRWFVEGGSAEDAGSGRIGLIREGPMRWRLGPLVLTGYGEAAFGRWQVSHGARVDRSGSQWFSLTPVLRVSSGERSGWFAEAGIGANLFSPSYRTANRRFSTAFNFGDHVGIGWRSGHASPWEVSLRAAHYSNGGIKKPNPGENFVQVRVGAAF